MSRKSAEISAQLNTLGKRRELAAAESARVSGALSAAYQSFIDGDTSIEQAIEHHARATALEHLVTFLDAQIEAARTRLRRLQAS